MIKWPLILSISIATFFIINCDTTNNTETIKTEDIVGNIPILELVGKDTISMDSGEAYVELGCNAFDQEDGFLSDSVKVGYYKYDKIATINTGSIGDSCCMLFVKYTVVDSDGNSAIKWRTIIIEVVDSTDTTINDTSITPKDTTVYLHINNIQPMISGDTITITLSVFKDSTFTEQIPDMRVWVSSAQEAWISKMPLTTNSFGSAYFQFSYTLPPGVSEDNISLSFRYNEQCLNTSVTVSEEVLIDNKKSMTISAFPYTLIADGESSSNISIKLKDENYNPMSNEVILFNTTSGNIIPSDTTNELGIATVKLISGLEQEYATVSARLKSDSTVTSSIKIFFNDTTKATISGILEKNDGTAFPAIEVYLLPTTFNPVQDSTQNLDVAISDSNGYFSFSAVTPGSYNIFAKDDISKSINLSLKIEVKAGSGLFASISFSYYGTLILYVPDVLNEDDFIYITGTLLKWKVSDLPKTSTGGYVISGLPSGNISSINTTSSFLPQFGENITIQSNDTTLIDLK